VKITAATLDDLAKRYQSARQSIARVKANTENTVGKIVRSAEVNSTSFAMGVINGRFKSPEVLGVPVDLGTGFGLHLLGFLDIGGDHLHNVGDGCTSSYFNTLGMGVGAKMLAEVAAQQGGGEKLNPLPSAP
jgi:hypothetical protein